MRVGTGVLCICAADLTGDLSQRPAARQLKQSLLNWLSQATADSLPQWEPADLARLLAQG
jgi:hypothetical protein